jgi:hypothetical protein
MPCNIRTCRHYHLAPDLRNRGHDSSRDVWLSSTTLVAGLHASAVVSSECQLLCLHLAQNSPPPGSRLPSEPVACPTGWLAPSPWSIYTRLEAEGLAPATVLQIHRILSRALKVALQRGYIARNVATLVDAPSVAESEIEPLTPEQAQRIMDLASARRNGTRWSVALGLGLRQGEALGLRWQFVDLDAGTLTIRWQLQRQRWRHGCADPHVCGQDRHRETCLPGCTGHARACPQRTGGGLQLTELKSDKSRRTIALPVPLVAALKAHRAEQLRERMTAGSVWADGDYVWCQRNGRPIGAHADWEEWKPS